MTTPAPSRTAEEMQEAIARFWWDRVCPTSYVGRWDEAKQHSGFFKQLVTETYEDAEAILKGPLAQLRSDLAAARKEAADYTAVVEQALRDKDEQIASLRSQLQEAQKALDFERAARLTAVKHAEHWEHRYEEANNGPNG